MDEQKINQLIEERDRLTNRRDEQIDFASVDAIDAQLAQVPAGVDNRIDLRLGRPYAVLPQRAEYQRWSSDEQRKTWHDEAAAQIEQAAQAKHDDFLRHIADQFEDMLDWHRLCGDLAL